jgi:hypothetical protein
MRYRHFMMPLTLCLCLVLAGCQQDTLPEAPGVRDLASELRRTPPPDRKGQCWGEDVTPAVIETVTEQVLDSPAQTDAAGQVIRPASYRTETRTRIVQDRGTVWFRIPCPEDLTLEFVASLQRALKARGIYVSPVTGQLDAATRDAVRRFQAPRGLDSPVLSLGAARELGLIAADFRG